VRRGIFLVLLPVLVAVALAGCGRSDTVRRPGDECAPARSPAVGTTLRTIQSGGESRTYLLHVPSGYDGSTRAPVVVLFHGYGGTPSAMVKTTHMDKLADEQGFILVAPQGRGAVSRWDFRSPITATGSDLGFVRDLVNEVKADACVDGARVYAAGFSNGSALTLALACDGTTKFAAYGAVSAPYYDAACATAPPAPIIYFHGMRDKVVPYGGAHTVIGWLPSVNVAMSEWATHDGCPPSDSTTTVSEHVRHFAWKSCRDDSAVEVYAVDNGGHRWPGGAGSSPGRVDGITTQEIDASTLIWEFFERHPRGGQ
jgi:polyhydroxybutyrate depolymerase